MENSSLRLQVPPLAGAVLQDQIYGSGWAFLRPEDVTGAHDLYGQVAGDLVRCALVERHLDLLVLGPLSDLLVGGKVRVWDRTGRRQAGGKGSGAGVAD